MKNSLTLHQFSLDHLFGKGPTGEIYLGKNLLTGDLVSLKIIPISKDHFFQEIQNFIQKQESLNQLGVQEILRFFTVIQEDESICIITEFFDAKNLRDSSSLFSLREKIQLMKKCAEILEKLHHIGIFHHNLKPENILIRIKKGSEPEIRLADAGILDLIDIHKLFQESDSSRNFVYLSPEQTGILKIPPDERSDLYSLGVSFYEFFMGQALFQTEEKTKTIYQLLSKKIEGMDFSKEKIPSKLRDVLLKLLSKDPQERYQSAQGLIWDLKTLLDDREELPFIPGSHDSFFLNSLETDMIGRKSEKILLKDRYEKMRKNFPQMVLLQGKTGLGKTRLIKDFLLSLPHQEDLLISMFQGSKLYRNSPYSPFSRWLHEATFLISPPFKKKDRVLSPVMAQGLVQMFPFLENRIPVSLKRDTGTGFNVCEVLCLFLNLLASRKNLIFVLDDAEELDQDSLDLLLCLSKKMTAGRIMFLLALSDDRHEMIFDMLQESPMITRITLNPLSPRESRRIVNHFLQQEGGFSEKFYDQIFENSLGFPLLIQEILNTLKNQGILKKENRSWKVQSHLMEQIPLETGLERFIEKKLEELTPLSLEILGAAALGPDHFTPYRISELTGIPDAELTLKQAEKLFLIQFSRGVCSFSHKKIREQILKKVPPEILARYHLVLAHEIGEKSPLEDEDVFQLAHHYAQTPLKEETLMYSRMAYERASARYALKERIYYLEQILEIALNQKDDFKSVLKDLMELSRLLQMNGKIQESFIWINRAMEKCRQWDLNQEAIELELLKAAGYYYLNRRDLSLDSFHQAMKNSAANGMEIKNGFAYRLLGSIYWFNFDLPQAESALNKALRYLSKDDWENILPAYGIRAWTHVLSGNLSQAFKDIRIAEKNLYKTKNPLLFAQIYHCASIVFSWGAKDYTKAYDYAVKAYEMAENSEYHIFQYSSLFSQGLSCFYQKHYSQAIEIMESALEFSNHHQIFIGIHLCRSLLAEALLRKGQIQEAHELASRFLKDRKDIQEKMAVLFYLRVESVYLFLKGRYQQTLHQIQEGLELSEKSGIVFLQIFFKEFKIRVLAALGEIQEKQQEKILLKYFLRQKEEYLTLYERELDFFSQFSELEKNLEKTKKITLREKIQIENLIQTSQMISSILDTDQLLKAILEKTLEITGAERGCLLLCDSRTKPSPNSMRKAIEIPWTQQSTLEIPSSMIQQVLENRKGVFYSENSGLIRSALCDPLIFNQELIGILYLESSLISGLFSQEEVNILGIFTTQAAISIVNAEKNRIIQRQFSDSIKIISELLASSSGKLYDFIEQVTGVAGLIAEKLHLPSEEKEKIRIAARLHDLGMIGISEKLLYGYYPLRPEEWELLHSHPEKSLQIVEHLYGIDEIRQMILQHEERYQGQGYPRNLKGNEINLGASILGLADDFVEMLSLREFQHREKKESILLELEKRKGVLYAPEVVDALLEAIREQDLIYTVREEDIELLEENGQKIWISPSHLNFESLVVGMVMDEVSLLELDSELLFSIDYSLCETFRNAVIHGNKYQESKKITLTFQIISEKNQKKLLFQISDEGDGMNIEEHNRFSESRKEIFALANHLKLYQKEKHLEDDQDLKQLVKEANKFKDTYYSDFNAYRKLQGKDLSGGLGLIYVKKTFDTVYFENLIKKNRVCGTRVTLEKNLL